MISLNKQWGSRTERTAADPRWVSSSKPHAKLEDHSTSEIIAAARFRQFEKSVPVNCVSAAAA